MPVHDNPSDACPDTCDTHDRRGFLKEGLMAVAALAALGVSAERLHALSLTYATGRRVGDVLRYPIPATDGATVDAEHKVIVARFEGTMHAFSLECPHRGEPVQWQPDNNRFFCPKHKSVFRPEGTFVEGKAERNMDRFPVRVEGTELVVDTTAMIRSDRDAEGWASAKVTA